MLGRDREVAALAAALAQAERGIPSIVGLVGDAGVGKTSLLYALDAAAGERGARMVWGRSLPSGRGPALWVWREVVRAIQGLLPGLTDTLPESHRETLSLLVSAHEAGVGRRDFETAAALRSLLGAVATDTTLVVALDDLHDTDESGRTLLTLLARSLTKERLCIVWTARPGVQLAFDVATIEIGGLDPRAVAAMTEERLGVQLEDEALSMLMAVTGGNPFFVDQILGWLPRGQLDATAIGAAREVRTVLNRRIDLMGTDARRALTALAILDEHATLASLSELADLDPRALSDAFATAMREGLLSKHGPRVSFPHALIAEATLDVLAPDERADWHVRAAAVLERRERNALLDRALAYHMVEAGRRIDPERAALQQLHIAKDSMRVSAWETAVDDLEVGLLLLADTRGATRLDLLLAIGHACRRAGQIDRSRAVYLEAVDAARAQGTPEALIEAALDIPRTQNLGRADPAIQRLVDEALDLTGPSDPSKRARLLARAAAEGGILTAGRRERETADEAVSIARAANDRIALASALSTRLLVGGSRRPIDAMLADALEAIEAARLAGDRELEIDAHIWILPPLLRAGDIHGAERQLGTAEVLANEYGDAGRQLVTKVRRALFALIRCDEDGARSVEEAVMVARRTQSPDAAGVEFNLRFVLDGERAGTGYELLIGHARALGLPAATKALIHAWCGKSEEGRRALHRAVAEIDHLPDGFMLGVWTAVAEAAALLEDEQAGAVVLPKLLPHAEEHAVIGVALIYRGPVGRYAGLAALAAGRLDQAITLLEDALERATSAAASQYVAACTIDLAAALHARATHADRKRAIELAQRGEAFATELKMPRFVALARSVLDASAATASLDLEGEVWTLRAGAELVRLALSKGIAQLSVLLANPGRPIPASVLTGVDLQGHVASLTVDAPGDPLLDDAAKESYRQRLDQLQRELDAADATGDQRRASKLIEERDTLLEELKRAAGLGGRARRMPDAFERARVNVTRTIRQTLDRILKDAPLIGAHLMRSIKTGSACIYQPADDLVREWVVRR